MNGQTPPRENTKTVATVPKHYDKDTLFGSAKEIVIRHGDLHYRLRETRNGKLILNL